MELDLCQMVEWIATQKNWRVVIWLDSDGWKGYFLEDDQVITTLVRRVSAAKPPDDPLPPSQAPPETPSFDTLQELLQWMIMAHPRWVVI